LLTYQGESRIIVDEVLKKAECIAIARLVKEYTREERLINENPARNKDKVRIDGRAQSPAAEPQEYRNPGKGQIDVKIYDGVISDRGTEGGDAIDEAIYFDSRIAGEKAVGEAVNGVTKRWTVIDVPPGTQQIKVEGEEGKNVQSDGRGFCSKRFASQAGSLADDQRRWTTIEVPPGTRKVVFSGTGDSEIVLRWTLFGGQRYTSLNRNQACDDKPERVFYTQTFTRNKDKPSQGQGDTGAGERSIPAKVLHHRAIASQTNMSKHNRRRAIDGPLPPRRSRRSSIADDISSDGAQAAGARHRRQSYVNDESEERRNAGPDSSSEAIQAEKEPSTAWPRKYAMKANMQVPVGDETSRRGVSGPAPNSSDSSESAYGAPIRIMKTQVLPLCREGRRRHASPDSLVVNANNYLRLPNQRMRRHSRRRHRYPSSDTDSEDDVGYHAGPRRDDRRARRGYRYVRELERELQEQEREIRRQKRELRGMQRGRHGSYDDRFGR
jgi:hypothetical protein